jgi:hypothetical protein
VHRPCSIWKAFGVAIVLSLTWGNVQLGAVESPLVWQAERNQMNASFEGWPLTKVLESLAGATGWQVFVEQEADRTVTTRFEKLPPPEALRRLLGDLNFTLLASSNSPPRLFIYRTSVENATQRIQPQKIDPVKAGAKAVGNELIVRLKSGAKETIEELAKRLGATVIGRMDDVRAYRLQFEDDAAATRARGQLAESDSVDSVDTNYILEPPARLQPVPLGGAPPLGVRPAVAPNSEYVVVALLDTAVNGDKSPAKDFLLPSVSATGTTAAPSDQLSHGTAMAETILQGLSVTPQDAQGSKVRILPIDVYGGSGSTTTFDVARGLYLAAGAGAKVINISSAGEADSPFLHQVIQDTAKQGPLIVAAPGNEPVTTPMYPAAWPEVLAPTASDRGGNVAAYANRGDFVDLMVPGTEVVHYGDQAYVGSGTSFSTALTSGMAAGYIASSGKTGSEVATDLKQKFPFKPPAK